MKKSVLAGTVTAIACCLNIACSQVIARITVAADNSIVTPLNIDLNDITSLPDSLLSLRETTGKMIIAVPFQVEDGAHRFMWWMLSKGTKPSKRIFELVKKTSSAPAPKQMLQLKTTDNNIVVTAGDKNVLQYNYATNYPPSGVDSSFKRSGFIHPLWSPSGNVLTRINPPDHYHHMGLWNPWTHMLFQGREVDCWNLGDKKGTVRFSKFISTSSGPVYAGFQALQEHIAFNIPVPGIEKTALNEVWNIKVYNTGNNIWICDFITSLNCATDSTVILKEYRYGGFGFRATEEWNNINSRVLTSAGKTRKNADASVARWCIIDGDMKNGRSGILFMSYPANYNFPEPMRVWPEDANKRGDVFFSFSPTRNKDWTLLPGKTYALRYRMLIYDGTITSIEAEQTWKSFAHPPEISIQRF